MNILCSSTVYSEEQFKQQEKKLICCMSIVVLRFQQVDKYANKAGAITWLQAWINQLQRYASIPFYLKLNVTVERGENIERVSGTECYTGTMTGA